MITALAEKRILPDRAIRFGIRRLLADRLRRSRLAGENAGDFANWLRTVDQLAVATDEANAQHYEVPADFFRTVLGSHLKYSCGYWPERSTTLDESEAAMLGLTCERAELEDGQHILELGCGWGSLSLWMAQHYPHCRITSMSNSNSQRQYIQQQAKVRGLTKLEVQTANVAEFRPAGQYDRVVSIEMFEHVRNYHRLLERIRGWLSTEGKLFVHIFCHRKYAYPFEVDEQHGSDSKNWMTRHFFTGGVMPSFNLFREFDHDLQIQSDWWIEGTHYARTCEAWLDKLDEQRDSAKSALMAGDNPASPDVQVQRWRMFFMACAELFAYDAGRQWGVGHYLFVPQN